MGSFSFSSGSGPQLLSRTDVPRLMVHGGYRSLLVTKAGASRRLSCQSLAQPAVAELVAGSGAAVAKTGMRKALIEHNQSSRTQAASQAGSGKSCNRSSNATAPQTSVRCSSVIYRMELSGSKDQGHQPAEATQLKPLPGPPEPPARRGVNGRPWTRLHARVHQALRAQRLLDTDSVLVAVSGGQDSMCLLQLLADLQPLFRWRLGVVHCDHGWRPDSAANAEFVRQFAEEQLQLPCYVRVAAPGSVHSEGRARKWRYGVFAEVAAAHGYSTVVTAHTATDRAETLMLNLLRGAGPDGLVALARERVLTAEGGEAAPERHHDGLSHGRSGSSKSRESDVTGSDVAGSGGGVSDDGSCGNGAGYFSGVQGPEDGLSLKSGSFQGGRSELGTGGSCTSTSDGDDSNDCGDLGPDPGRRGERISSSTSNCGVATNGGVSNSHGKNSSSNNSTSACTQPTRLVRPLLEFTRDDIQTFVQQLQLPYYHDTTNDCNDLRRNLLRNEVMPLLRLRFNRRLDQALFRFMEVLQAETEYMEEVTDGLYGSIAVRASASVDSEVGCVSARGDVGSSVAGEDEVLLLGELRRLPVALQRRVVHKWLRAAVARYRGGYGGGAGNDGEEEAAASGAAPDIGSLGRGSEVGYEDVSRCLALLHAPNRSNSDALCGGLVASVREGRLRVRTAQEWVAEEERELQRRQQQQRGNSSRLACIRCPVAHAG
ncbi:hypothetical protein Agub_g9211 [Astrephomene gubernaculifera]|uniref:tRNA(Ile)-lysidine synthetase n=1 Tax=Astrephomene gubernaculifera TaxID=47775 RepID=A0AAD3HNQ9_9CHLO|nr:hypothetical protein Agub_g9211 [Astrephomene gubernaculifera]